MRYFETQIQERIGLDFYCDIAIKLVEARKNKKLTQKELAELTGISELKIVKFENVQSRVKLDDLEKISKALDVTVNWLIDAKIDSQVGDCMYTVCCERADGHPDNDFALYQKASSKRMAYLMWELRLNKVGCRTSGNRTRYYVKLVGIPVTNREIEDHFPKDHQDEELPIK